MTRGSWRLTRVEDAEDNLVERRVGGRAHQHVGPALLLASQCHHLPGASQKEWDAEEEEEKNSTPGQMERHSYHLQFLRGRTQASSHLCCLEEVIPLVCVTVP